MFYLNINKEKKKSIDGQLPPYLYPSYPHKNSIYNISAYHNKLNEMNELSHGPPLIIQSLIHHLTTVD